MLASVQDVFFRSWTKQRKRGVKVVISDFEIKTLWMDGVFLYALRDISFLLRDITNKDYFTSHRWFADFIEQIDKAKERLKDTSEFEKFDKTYIRGIRNIWLPDTKVYISEEIFKYFEPEYIQQFKEYKIIFPNIKS